MKRFGRLAVPVVVLSIVVAALAPGLAAARTGPNYAPGTPSNAVKVGALTRNVKLGTGTLQVTVPGEGKVVMSGSGVKKVSRTAIEAGHLKLPVSVIGASKKALTSKGKVTVTVKVVFTPTGGKAATRTKSLVLMMKKA